jgi:hypothetical protein
MMSETDRRATIDAKLREVGALHETFAASLRGMNETMKALDTQVAVLGNIIALIQMQHGEVQALLCAPCEEDDEPV